MKAELAKKLLQIQHQDQKSQYNARNLFVYEAVALAIQCGYDAGIRIDAEEPEWPVAFIELPTGQVSWHLPQHVKPWDNHTTQEKQIAILEFVADTVGAN